MTLEIDVRDVPELLVVTEQRNLSQAELTGWLPGAMARVATAAGGGGSMLSSTAPWLKRDGRPAGPVFIVIYDGNPNEGEVPVEVCAPLAADGAEPAAAATRRLPAHREAYVRLTKAETEPPEKIGAAYGAVEAWVRGQGFEIAAPPREVYYTDYFGAGPGDEVFDVAFPIQS
jgi:effector-binding domain-containing protein